MTNNRGRPRGFDKEVALDRALAVFWSHGFQGASLAELTATMGVNKPSLYAAYGDKEALYLRALERYADVQMKQRAAILTNEPNGRRAVECFLRSMAAMLADPKLPGGCFIINGSADCGASSTPPAVESALRKALQGSEKMLRERLLKSQRDGDLAANVRTQDLAASFIALFAGLSVLAKGGGASRRKLDAVISMAMSIWPDSTASGAIRNHAPKRAVPKAARP